MIAEILAIGSEIVSGAKLDTNSQWLSQRLGELGVEVRYHTSVADDLLADTSALTIASGRADLVVISGGLGPTLDDLTREAMAAAAGVPLVPDPLSLAHIEEMFRRRGRPMPERNRIQAAFPQGGIPLANPIGTAPGIWMELPRAGRPACLVAALPGVPTELKRMFLDQVVPRLPLAGHVIRHARINCFGCGESQAEELLGDLTARGRDPEIGITAHDATITLRIQAMAATETECLARIQAASQEIRARLGTFVFGIEDEELADVVLGELHRRGETLCAVDCGSKGWLAQALSEVRGPARSALAGCVTCHRLNDAAAALGFTGPIEHDHRGLMALAAAARSRSGPAYALAIGEVPDVAADALAASSGHADVLVVGPAGTRRGKVALGGNPAILAARLGKTALDLLRQEMTT